MTDLQLRSARHWSEQGRAEMEAFYCLAADDYRHLALAKNWVHCLETIQKAIGNRAIRLLDVACGSGKFPNALVDYGGLNSAQIRPIETALLDASAFSIAEAKAALPEQFRATIDYEVLLQDFIPPCERFDIVWATHALYVLSEEDLAQGLRRFRSAIAPGGVGIIAHSAAAGHYIAFHRQFLAATGQANQAAFASAEMILRLLKADGATVSTKEIQYKSIAALSERDAVEGFLQRCLFDDTIALTKMNQYPELAAYLGSCRSAAGWAFPQTVWLMTING